MPDGDPYVFTGWKLQKRTANAEDVVGQGYIKQSKGTRGDWVNFDYIQGSSHSQTSTLGVGVSGYGVSAGYSSTGTHKSTASGEADWPRQFKNTLFETEFTTARYMAMCTGSAYEKVPRVKQHPPKACPEKDNIGDGIYSYVHKCLWEVSSTGWATGTGKRRTADHWHTLGINCTHWLTGSKFRNDYGTAVNWATDFFVGLALHIKGVNLKTKFGTTTQTGYDANAVMEFGFGHYGWMCGVDNVPSKAPVLVQRATKG
jgi:hypothetical protein